MATYDWEAIKRDYRTGRFSLNELERRHGAPRSTIHRRVKSEGWEKDLTKAVAQRTREKISRPVIPDAEASANPLDDEAIIEAAAGENASVVRSHREGLALWRGIAEGYGQELKAQVLAGTRRVVIKGEVQEVDVDLEYVGKCISHGTAAMERVVRMERQTYNLDAPADETPPERALSDEELEAEIQRLMAQHGPGQ